MKNIIKAFLPSFMKNFIFRFYIILLGIIPKYISSQKFWSRNVVDAPNNGFSDIGSSLKHLNWRNNQYIDFLKNMPMNEYRSKVVLDFGCGPGNDLINIGILSKPKRIIGIDVSNKAIQLAKKRTSLHNINVDFYKINENQKMSQISNKSIDIIQSNGVLHHINDLNLVFKEFDRVLKDDGIIKVMVYNKNSIWFHLHVAYEIKVKKALWKTMKTSEIFSKTTDGFDCPVSKCYSPDEFIQICKENYFEAKLSGISISVFEMTKINLIWEALKSKSLEKESSDFLKKIEYNKKGLPIVNEKIAGINSYFELTKLK